MSKLVALEHLTLDGVMQAPARPDEDTRDGFTFGGWATPGTDAVMTQVMARSQTEPGALLLGRKTYADFFEVWPNRSDNPYTDVLNRTQKYVVSATLQNPLVWANSTLLRGDAVESITQLKSATEGTLLVMGSGALLRSLMPHHVVDEYRLLIHPLVLGAGHQLFESGVACARLELVESQVTTTGVIMATYRDAQRQR